MLKFKYNNEVVEIEVKTDFNKENAEILSKLTEDICKSSGVSAGYLKPESIKSYTNALKSVDESEVSITEKPIEEKPYVRHRLPNGGEDKNIRVGDYEAVGEKVTAHYNFMCPDCHQAMSIKIGNNIIIKDIESEDKTLHMLNSSFPGKSNKEILAYKPEELGAFVEESDVVVMSSDELQGVCINCGHMATTRTWTNTYINKDSILESDKHCDACGTEMLYNVLEGGKVEYICDNKHCGYKIIITQ